MLVSDFHFDLPKELIAQHPAAERSGARMLTLDRSTGAISDKQFRDLPDLLVPGDLLVMNNSRVLPARLTGIRIAGTGSRAAPAGGGKIDVLLVEELVDREWLALVRPGRKVRLGDRILFGDRSGPSLEAEIIAHQKFGERVLRFAPIDDFYQSLQALGSIPLPHYIRRDPTVPDLPEDRERYQTVFANALGSVAAPTAGLHFTPEILDQLRVRGVRLAEITLHVGLGTFQPIRTEHLQDHTMHQERYTVSAEAASEINSAIAEDRRIVAVGTTTVRTLEHCAAQLFAEHGSFDGLELQPHTGRTQIFLHPREGQDAAAANPGATDQFRIVNALLTNFHLPESTLLMLVCAFAGTENVLAAYRHAVHQQYRFFSYGDCMLIS